MILLRSFSTLVRRRPGILKIVDKVEKETGEKVSGAFFTRLVRNAWHSGEITDLLAEAEQRFDPLPWQFLAAAAHVSSGSKINNPRLAHQILMRISSNDVRNVHEGVLRSVLGNASKHCHANIALNAFQLLRNNGSELTVSDFARVIHTAPEETTEIQLIDEVLRMPCPTDLDERALGVLLKSAQRRLNIEMGLAIWRWAEPARQAAHADRLVHPIIQLLLLCGQTGNAQIATSIIWNECENKLGLADNEKIQGAMLAVFALHGDASATSSFIEKYVPVESMTSRMLVSSLTAYSHAGETEKALSLFEKVCASQSTQIVGIESVTALVDGFARKGEFESALNVLERAKEQEIVLDDVVWMTLLSPCRHHKRLDIAQRAFDEVLKKGDAEHLAAAYVLMADVYKACGDSVTSAKLHKIRLEKGLHKARGAVTVTVNGRQHSFHVGFVPPELSHAQDAIFKKLDEWSSWLAARGVATSSIKCRHSEKLALAYAVTQNEKKIIMRKNLRVCSVCHEASRELTLLEDIVIHHWDQSRVHIMKDGKCSCNGHY